MENLITDREAAQLLGVSVQTLRRDRCVGSRGFGIPFIKIGSAIRYRPSQLQTWMDSQTINMPGVEQPPRPIPVPQPKPEGARGRGRPRKLQQVQPS